MKTAEVFPAKTFSSYSFLGTGKQRITNEIVPSAEDKHYVSIVVRSRVYCGGTAAQRRGNGGEIISLAK